MEGGLLHPHTKGEENEDSDKATLLWKKTQTLCYGKV